MVYLDTSVVVALLTQEPATERAAAWFDAMEDTPVSADWLLTEFSSAISIKLRTGQIAEIAAKAVRKEFQFLVSNGVRLVPVSRAAFKAAADMAQAHGHGLRSGDALHLAVAREMGADMLATLDATMALNARRFKLSLVKFS